MISVIIPTLNAEETLPHTLSALVTPLVKGVVRQVVISDGGSSDQTVSIAEAAGATVIVGPKGRGRQLVAGAALAKGPWLLFLHADTVLSSGWHDEVGALIERIERGTPVRGIPADGRFAAAFRFGLDDVSWSARILEQIVALRCRVLKLPYGDQALLIPQNYYHSLGGYREIDLMEDVDLVRRIGRRRIVLLRHHAITSARRYQHHGYIIRPLRNSFVMLLYLLRVPSRILVRLYG